MKFHLIERAHDRNEWVQYFRSNVHEFEKEELVYIFSFFTLHQEIFEEIWSDTRTLNFLLERIDLYFDSFTTDERHNLFETFFSGNYRNVSFYDSIGNKEIRNIHLLDPDQLLRSIRLFAKNPMPLRMLIHYITRLTHLDKEIGDHYFDSLNLLLKHSVLPPLHPITAFSFVQLFKKRLTEGGNDIIPPGCTIQSIGPVLHFCQGSPNDFEFLSNYFVKKAHLFLANTTPTHLLRFLRTLLSLNPDKQEKLLMRRKHIAKALAKSLETSSPIEAGHLIKAAAKLSLPITAQTEPALLRNIRNQLYKLEEDEMQAFANRYLTCGQGWFSLNIIKELGKFLPEK